MDDRTKETQSVVAYQNSARTFSHKLYPSDIKYNFVEGIEDDDKYKVYVVYRIMVNNNTTHNLPDLYKETSLHLTSLTDTFDNYIYELNKDDIGDENVAREMERWNLYNNIATYNITGSGKRFETGMTPDSENINNVENTYIQFKVTDKFLGDRVGLSEERLKEIYANLPSIAKASGYHMYRRYDKNWKDKNEYSHRTIESDDESGALGINWKLADTRKISGTVFEDSKDDNRENERIGNGYKDENEKTISDVVVSLMNVDNNDIAKVYNGDLIPPDQEGGKWRAIGKDAIVKIEDDGYYEIPDVIPGRYYLKFTYGNGMVEYTDINGKSINEIKTQIEGKVNPIEPSLYKSTILTGAVKDANGENWFLADNGKDNSIATDVDIKLENDAEAKPIDSRYKPNNIETELNHDYLTKNSKAIINANSPNMNIRFEYIPEDYKQFYGDERDKLTNGCTGMSFGIIERPHVIITLTKKIKNFKLTLQNGTTIINENPATNNVSPNFSRLGENYAKVELDTSTIYGSNAIISYALSAHNLSELDYATSEYYKYGIVGDLEPVSTEVTRVVDYINNQNASYENQSENIVKDTSINKENYFYNEVLEANKNYKQTIFKPEKWLKPFAYNPDESSTEDYEFTINNLLSNSDGMLGWESYSEIIGIKNVTLTPQFESHSGSYIVGATEGVYKSEPDTANATISIYTYTGENRNMIIYYIAGGILIILAISAILVKKFIIKKK